MIKLLKYPFIIIFYRINHGKEKNRRGNLLYGVMFYANAVESLEWL